MALPGWQAAGGVFCSAGPGQRDFAFLLMVGQNMVLPHPKGQVSINNLVGGFNYFGILTRIWGGFPF